MLLEAIKAVLESRRATTSYLQRKLKVGYYKTVMFLETMERCGIVSPPDNGKRSILVESFEEAKARLPQ